VAKWYVAGRYIEKIKIKLGNPANIKF